VLTQENINELFEAIDNRDAIKFATYISEDGKFTFGNAPSMIGRDNIRAGVGAFFDSITGLKHSLSKILFTDNHIVTYGTVLYTRKDNSQLEVNFANVFKMQGQLIKDYAIYIDLSQLYQY